MICSKCKKNQAHVHYKETINGKTTQLDLCQTCAEKIDLSFFKNPFGPGSLFGSDINFSSHPPLFEEMFNLLSDWPKSGPPQLDLGECPTCKWSLKKFQKSGRLGCPDCYAHFRSELIPILKNIHGRISHKGKQSKPVERKKKEAKMPKHKTSDRPSKISVLKQDLQKAVAKEEYERAAVIRDEIKELESRS